jgi:phosphoglucomutase
MALGETQAILKGNAEAKLNEQIAQRVKMTVEKEKKRIEEQHAKKKSREKEIRDFYDNFVRFFRSSIPRSIIKSFQHKLQAETSRAQKEKDRQELQEYLRIQAESVAQKEAQKATQLKEGKALQEVHRKQIVCLTFYEC